MPESYNMQKWISGALQYQSYFKIVDRDHSEIHDGNFYTVYQTTSSLGASSWIDFYFVASTATTAYVHLKQIDATVSGGLFEVAICEGATTMTLGATTCVVYNRNRNSTNLPYLSIYKNTTWSSTTGGITTTQADVISRFYIGTTGSAANRLGASESNTLEWVLKQATTYIVRITNNGAAGYASLRLHFYEE